MKHSGSHIAKRRKGTVKRRKGIVKHRKGTVKHPLVAITIASGRIVLLSLRHPAKPMRVDYRTGDVWLDSA